MTDHDDDGWIFNEPVEVQCPICGAHFEPGHDHECEVKPLWSWVTLLLIVMSGALSVWCVIWIAEWVEGRR